MRLALGSKKGAPETPKDTIEKARLMYMSEQYTLERIAQECGVTARTIYNLKKRYGWEEKLKEQKQSMSMVTELTGNKANASSSEEISIRSNLLSMGHTLLLCLSDHVIIKDGKTGRPVGRKKDLSLKDLKIASNILKDVEQCLFNAIGASEKRELDSSDQMKIVQLMIQAINDEVPDPNVRRRIQAKFVELDEQLEGPGE
jgi:hypothetical protein